MNLDPQTVDDLALLYYGLFSTPTGETVLADLDRVHANTSTVRALNGEYFPPHVTQSRAGERQVTIRIHELIELGRELNINPRPKPQSESEDEL